MRSMRLAILFLTISVVSSILFSFQTNRRLTEIEGKLKNCRAQIRGMTECINDCIDEVEAICAELERSEDDGR